MWNGHRTVDVHGHMTTPPEFRAFSHNLTANRTPRTAKLEISDDRLENALGRHMKKIDDGKIDYQLLGPRPVSYWHFEAMFIQRKWAEVTNDVIAQTVRLHPDRFAGMAQLPQHFEHDIEESLEEFERAVKDLGFVGAYVNPDPGGNHLTPGMNDEYWFPLYELASELDAPLLVHPSISLDPRLEIIPASYQYNNVTEEYLALQLLTHSDVFDQFPKLKIIICHFGGALDRFVLTDTGHISRKGYGTNLFFDTCAYDNDFVAAAVKQKGANACVFGTEAPGSGGAIHPDTGKPSDEYVVDLLDHLPFLSDADKLAILQTTPLKVFSRIDQAKALGTK